MPITKPLDYWYDLEAAFADLFDVRVMTDDQRAALAVLPRYSRVAIKGGNGTGKSFLCGGAAAVYCASHPGSKSLFTAPTLRQAKRLSWGELQTLYEVADIRLRAAGLTGFGGKMLEEEWRFGRDWYALAFSTKDVGASEAKARAKGFHARDQLALLDESNAVPESVHQAIEDTWQGSGARIWQLVNPTAGDKLGRFGRFWNETDPAARLTFSAEAAVEYQERHGVEIPGMATRRWLEDMRRKWNGTARWATAVTGDWPDESSDDVVVPESWARRVVNCIPEPAERDKRERAVGVDTSWGGASKTVFAPRIGRVVFPLSVAQGIGVPETAGRLMVLADQYGGKAARIVVDVIGTGGAGTYDLVRAQGYTAEKFRGGDPARSDDYANRIAEAWWSVRNAVRRTCEAMDAGKGHDAYEISLPDDDELIVQFSSRKYEFKGDKKLALESKDDMTARGLPSPDRADAVAMAMAQSTRPQITLNVMGG